MDNLEHYTTAELRLMLLRHFERSVIFPDKILREIREELAYRARQALVQQ